MATWGGKRKGAGRKTTDPTKAVSITLPTKILQQIDQQAERDKISRSQVIAHRLHWHLRQDQYLVSNHIRCEIERPFKTAILLVLHDIQDSHPQDYVRIVEKVKEVKYTSDSDAAGGMWEPGRGIVYLPARVPQDWIDHYKAVTAHEFGHVCTTDQNLKRRRCPVKEWRSELCANYYAYKWGFKTETQKFALIAGDYVSRHLPGTRIGLGGEQYQISDNFVWQEITPEYEHLPRYTETSDQVQVGENLFGYALLQIPPL